MPFTPFHFGPGLLAKGIFPKRFSWSAFAAAQVLIDCETLCHMLRHDYPVHRELHTFIGATLAGLAAAGLVIAVDRAAPALRGRCERAPAAVLAGGLFGGASHPFFDGLMHSDIRPFMPWTDANPLLGQLGAGTLHLGCVLAGLAGAALLWARTRA